MIIGFCLLWMESKEENVALTIIQRDNTLSIDESLLMSLSHNKPKKSVTTTIVPKGEELAALENAQVETVEDVNGLKAIKVTFDSGILFPKNGTALNAASKAQLKKFADSMADMPETNITIYGHTDTDGTYEVNQRVSNNRALSVENYLASCGISKDRMTAQGLAYDFPVASNDTPEGKAQNRRVEVYITANDDMIKEAEAEAAKTK